MQLKVVYQKYFDLLKEFSARYPFQRIFGRRNIYITLENTVNFRQTLREVDLLLRQTRGTIYLINVGERHPEFAKLLKKGIAERFSWSDRVRIRVRSLEVTMERQVRNDATGIILSSATPLEWRNLRQSIGDIVHGASPLLKLGNIAGLFTALEPGTFNDLIGAARHHIADQYAALRAQRHALRNVTATQTLDAAWTAFQAEGIQMTNTATRQRLSIFGQIRLLRAKVSYTRRGKTLRRQRATLEAVERQINELRTEYDHLRYIDYEFRHVPDFYRLNHLSFESIAHDEPLFQPGEPTPFVSDDPLSGRYILYIQFHHRAVPAHTLQRQA